jgi:hypothetical protein
MVRSACLHALASLALASCALAAQAASDLASPLVVRLSLLGAAAPGRGDLSLNLGALSAKPQASRKRAILVRERIAVRLEGSRGMARVSVALAQDTPGTVIRVNGQPVSTMPRVIDAAHRVGATVVHQLEVSIAADAPAGAFLSNLLWVAETD